MSCFFKKNRTPKKSYRSEENSKKNEEYRLNEKSVFPLRINKITYDPWRSPPSLPHLIIGIKNEFLAHFYSSECENENWEVARSPIPLGSHL
jgi:hypothetical protein